MATLRLTEKRRKPLGFLLLALGLCCVIFILTRSLKPASVSSRESGRILQLLQRIWPGATVHFVRKLAHFTEFFALGLLLGGGLLLLRVKPVWPLAVCVLVAVSDETVQRFIEGRSCELRDMLLDSAGALCAIALLQLIVRLRRRKKINTE